MAEAAAVVCVDCEWRGTREASRSHACTSDVQPVGDDPALAAAVSIPRSNSLLPVGGPAEHFEQQNVDAGAEDPIEAARRAIAGPGRNDDEADSDSSKIGIGVMVLVVGVILVLVVVIALTS
mmetsp:Transcript_41155/g.127094  ORF Transcript_41155/g.127094 Transcript_41155/m.127094 type:complete len:122 (+) Transcript_41155:2233-2598(+)